MNKLQIQQARLNQIVMSDDFGPTAVVLEGRDTAGKSSTIREVTHYLPVSKFSVQLSTKPSKETMDNWLDFWKTKMPFGPQVVFYDRSWYSRAMVQKINGWCSDEQYQDFMTNVNEWEEQFPVRIIKFWLSISEQEQSNRIKERKYSPLKFWKLSPNDERALSYYDEMTLLKEKVLTTTDNWYTINYNNKAEGRLALITRLCDILETNSEKSS
ncbi:MAG: polyphosphate kinase [Pseudomonadota bacterium]|nr:polyphosphate kinase [Pseudomonadota bacterium]